MKPLISHPLFNNDLKCSQVCLTVVCFILQGFQGKTGPPGPGGVVGPQVQCCHLNLMIDWICHPLSLRKVKVWDTLRSPCSSNLHNKLCWETNDYYLFSTIVTLNHCWTNHCKLRTTCLSFVGNKRQVKVDVFMRKKPKECQTKASKVWWNYLSIYFRGFFVFLSYNPGKTSGNYYWNELLFVQNMAIRIRMSSKNSFNSTVMQLYISFPSTPQGQFMIFTIGKQIATIRISKIQ